MNRLRPSGSCGSVTYILEKAVVLGVGALNWNNYRRPAMNCVHVIRTQNSPILYKQ